MDQNKLLVKLENAGVYRSSKWLVRGISLEINQNNDSQNDIEYHENR